MSTAAEQLSSSGLLRAASTTHSAFNFVDSALTSMKAKK